MKRPMRLRRRDGVVQTYHVGRRQRVRKMAVSPPEFKKAFSKDSAKEARAALSQLSKKQMKEIGKYIDAKDDIGELYGIKRGTDVADAIRDGIVLQKSKRRGIKTPEPDSPGWADWAAKNVSTAAKIAGRKAKIIRKKKR